MLKTNGP